MNCTIEARKLANYITKIDGSFLVRNDEVQFSYSHIGALYTDIVLQAGVNYNAIVKPRVQKILLEYSEAYTLNKFLEVIDAEGLENVINWRHYIKLNRMRCVMDYSKEREINTCNELKENLMKPKNQEAFLKLNGIGPKTLDYLMKLLDFDSVAVDRHIYSFVELADIKVKDYYTIKKIVEYAADFLQISRSSIDHSIWQYMSKKKYLINENIAQLTFDFP